MFKTKPHLFPKPHGYWNEIWEVRLQEIPRYIQMLKLFEWWNAIIQNCCTGSKPEATVVSKALQVSKWNLGDSPWRNSLIHPNIEAACTWKGCSATTFIHIYISIFLKFLNFYHFLLSCLIKMFLVGILFTIWSLWLSFRFMYLFSSSLIICVVAGSGCGLLLVFSLDRVIFWRYFNLWLWLRHFADLKHLVLKLFNLSIYFIRCEDWNHVSWSSWKFQPICYLWIRMWLQFVMIVKDLGDHTHPPSFNFISINFLVQIKLVFTRVGIWLWPSRSAFEGNTQSQCKEAGGDHGAWS